MIWIVKIVFVIALLWAGWRATRMFRSGCIRLFDTDGPVSVIAQHDSPFAYWSVVVLFYGVLLATAAAAATL